MASLIQQCCSEINGNSFWKKWKDKVDNQINANGYVFPNQPSKETIISFANDVMFEYHAKNIEGKMFSSKYPTDEDIELFTKIIIAVLYEWQVIDAYDKYDEKYRELERKLKLTKEAKELELIEKQ